ncbi:MAG TPA: aspartate-semialdehyde dehydrogenase [Planctomycetota bacterium]|nr:aspartate-semialdehyde dehydrogenase [Planctomycetota bacterium]
MTARLPVVVLGATGVVGQRFLRRLAAHPRFEVAHVCASEKSAGKRLKEAATWRLGGEEWAGLGDRVVAACDPDRAFAPVAFSALDADVAREVEPRYAERGALVFSNASAFRMEPDVPLLIPEVNAPHLALVHEQRRRRGRRGAIVCNPNCTATVLASALAPLRDVFGVEAAAMTSLQAVSGAGYPGVASLDVLGNVVPFIRNEEAKVEEETPKMLGRLEGGRVAPHPLAVSAACLRVAVVDGHTEAVSARLVGAPSPAAVREAFAGWRPPPIASGLPSAPRRAVVLHDADDRPQPRLDAESDGGLATHVGRVRACALFGVKFVVLGHNAERGAAGASVLNAELALAEGLL